MLPSDKAFIIIALYILLVIVCVISLLITRLNYYEEKLKEKQNKKVIR